MNADTAILHGTIHRELAHTILDSALDDIAVACHISHLHVTCMASAGERTGCDELVWLMIFSESKDCQARADAGILLVSTCVQWPDCMARRHADLNE